MPPPTWTTPEDVVINKGSGTGGPASITCSSIGELTGRYLMVDATLMYMMDEGDGKIYTVPLASLTDTPTLFWPQPGDTLVSEGGGEQATAMVEAFGVMYIARKSVLYRRATNGDTTTMYDLRDHFDVGENVQNIDVVRMESGNSDICICFTCNTSMHTYKCAHGFKFTKTDEDGTTFTHKCVVKACLNVHTETSMAGMFTNMALCAGGGNLFFSIKGTSVVKHIVYGKGLLKQCVPRLPDITTDDFAEHTQIMMKSLVGTYEYVVLCLYKRRFVLRMYDKNDVLKGQYESDDVSHFDDLDMTAYLNGDTITMMIDKWIWQIPMTFGA